MKTLFVAVIIFLIPSSSMGFTTGQDWKSWNTHEKLLFLTAYEEGLNVALCFLDADSCQKMMNRYIPGGGKMTFGDIIDLVDDFYSDPANRLIWIRHALQYEIMKISGDSKESLDFDLRMLRGTSNKK